MLCIPHKLQERGFNRRPFTADDFDEICEEEGIEVIEVGPIPVKGFYTERFGIPVIVINPALSGLRRLLTGFHELVHYLLHSPDSAYFPKAGVLKIDREARALAVCALIPETMIPHLIEGDPPEEDSFLYEILRERLQVLEERHT
jgi:Zn-dependent peptidase ImmA (M78 family)